MLQRSDRPRALLAESDALASFVRCLLLHDVDAFMLKPDYESMLTDDEKLLAAALEQLSHSVSSLEDAPGLRRVHSLLSEFGLEGGE